PWSPVPPVSWWSPLHAGGTRGGIPPRPPTTILRPRLSSSRRRSAVNSSLRSRSGTTVPAPRPTIRPLPRAQRCGSGSRREPNRRDVYVGDVGERLTVMTAPMVVAASLALMGVLVAPGSALARRAQGFHNTGPVVGGATLGTSRSVAVPFPDHPFVSCPFVRP